MAINPGDTFRSNYGKGPDELTIHTVSNGIARGSRRLIDGVSTHPVELAVWLLESDVTGWRKETPKREERDE